MDIIRSNEYSPEQKRALINQGNALGLPVIVFLFLSCLCTGLKWFFPTINVSSADWVISFVAFFFIIALVGVAVYVAISSIKNRISILRGRYQKEYPSGENAVWAGVSLLFLMGVAFLIWWLASTGQK